MLYLLILHSLYNLTKAHLSPLQKMRVCLAAEVISNHVAAGIHYLVGSSKYSTVKLLKLDIVLNISNILFVLQMFWVVMDWLLLSYLWILMQPLIV